MLLFKRLWSLIAIKEYLPHAIAVIALLLLLSQKSPSQTVTDVQDSSMIDHDSLISHVTIYQYADDGSLSNKFNSETASLSNDKVLVLNNGTIESMTIGDKWHMFANKISNDRANQYSSLSGSVEIKTTNSTAPFSLTGSEFRYHHPGKTIESNQLFRITDDTLNLTAENLLFNLATGDFQLTNKVEVRPND
ncbi:MAG: LPS export ABC transporter periplasmic protein LptC [Kangiellaceae bacterium]|jgi:LPS export ABC transporter protein LptC|nr:LPS export ABC transporter periplasmic protein LptC [Kangiellaceae bacterium]